MAWKKSSLKRLQPFSCFFEFVDMLFLEPKHADRLKDLESIPR
jgi:hypothetical protein